MRTLFFAAIASLVATSAGAAKVSEVRVGTHEQHTRIVLELDAATGYRLVAPQPGASPELVVTLDATSVARDIPSKSPLVRKVHVEPSGSGGSSVRIRLATADVAVKEMLLANPPRLVFDLSARGPIPKQSAEELAEESAAAQIVAEEPTAPAEEPAKAEAPQSAPIVVAAAEPVKEMPAPAPASEPTAATDASPAPVGVHDAPAADPAPGQSIGQQLAAEPAPMPQADVAPAPKPMSAAPQKSAEERRKAIAAKAQSETTPAVASQSFFTSPMGMAAIGGGVLLLIAIVVIRRRRAAQEEEDPLYTVMSAEDQSAIAGVSKEIGSSRPAAPSWDTAAFESSEPAFVKDGPRQLPLGSRSESEAEMESTPEPEPFASADDGPDSIFAGEPEPVAAPQLASMPVAPAVAMAAPASVVSSDMERRIGELERRLEQLTEARERLERQVAAQTEELRVQRAAIARTQRVVRSIAKTEDMATEPVPRAPSA